MPTSKPRLSAYHKVVFTVGLAFLLTATVSFAVTANQAIWPSDATSSRARRREMYWSIVNGENVRDAAALATARFWLAALIIGLIAFMALMIIPAVVKGDRGAKLELNGRDMSFWQVGDRIGWRADDGVHTGVIEQAHRRPFDFNGERINAFPGGPGLVISDDATGELVGRSFGSSFRIKGTGGPSGTLESIRADMNAAVSVGDDFAWLDAAGEPVEGVVVEIHGGPFTVGRYNVQASVERPGYTVRRADGTLLGIGSDLREKP